MPAWKRKIGLFADDEAFAEIVRLGAKTRREDRPGKAKRAPRRESGTGKKRNSATTAKGSK